MENLPEWFLKWQDCQLAEREQRGKISARDAALLQVIGTVVRKSLLERDEQIAELRKRIEVLERAKPHIKLRAAS